MVNKNNERKLPKVVCDLVYLLACAVHSRKPDLSIASEMDFEALYQFSKFHSLTAMTYMAIDYPDILALAEPSVISAWKEEKDRAIRKNMLFDAERKLILADLEAAGIWYMPMKGAILQKYYPKYGMRQMGDNDIYFDKSREKDVKKIMKSHGYKTVKSTVKCNHIEFEKDPMYLFEMHTGMVGASTTEFIDYYDKIKSKMIKDDVSDYGYHLSPEDFYIYMVVHEFKHHQTGGTGLRSLVDKYIFVSQNGDCLNWNYVFGEISKLGIVDFERQTRELAMKFFKEALPISELNLSYDEKACLMGYANSGTYGTMQKIVSQGIDDLQCDKGKITFSDRVRYMWSRIYPGREWLKVVSPVCAKHKILLPFFLIKRMFLSVVINGGRVITEMKILFGRQK